MTARFRPGNQGSASTPYRRLTSALVTSVRAVSSPFRSAERVSQSLATLPPYVFAELERLKAAARNRGVAFVDLGIGSPDRPTPQPVMDALQKAAADPSTHGYPAFR